MNYNDGKWHGWNGGECPVHPYSEIVVKWSCNGIETKPEFSLGFGEYWEGSEICAFRVTKEHKEPREFWVWNSRIYGDKDSAYRASERQHDTTYSIISPPYKVREVLE